MSNHRIQRAITQAILAATFSLTLFSPIYAATLTQTGAPGTNGTNATTDAGNGTNGTPGQDLTIPISSSDPSNSITITGGTGGNGGNGAPTTSAPQAGNAGAGANGGNASITATLSPTSNSTSNLTATGGNGGQAGLPGPAGISSTAGNISTAGNGGIANTTANITSTGNITISLISQGGAGGNNQASNAVGGTGGNSTSTIVATNSNGTLDATSFSAGGEGGDSGVSANASIGGNAFSLISAKLFGTGNAMTVTSTSNAGTSNLANLTFGGSGGNATSSATATTDDNAVTVTSNAFGGSSIGGFGGNSTAQAQGLKNGSFPITVQATAIAGTGSTDGSAQAGALGSDFSGLNPTFGTGKVTVTATATAAASSLTINPGSAQATAEAMGRSGTASSTSNIGNINGITRPIAYMSLNAVTPVFFNGVSINYAVTGGNYSPSAINNKSLAPTFVNELSTFSAQPSKPQTATALASSPQSNSNFNPLSSEDLGLGTFSFNSDGQSNAYHASAVIYIDPAHLQLSPQDLFLDLLDVSSTDAGGFSSLHFHVFATQGPNVYIDQIFTTLAAADAYFTDDPLNLGAIGSLHTVGGMIDLGISVDAVTTNAGDYLAFDYMLANTTPNSNPTPEPTSLSLLAAAFPLLCRRRRHSPPSTRH